MIARIALVTVAAFWAVVPTGCQKSTGSAAAAPAAITDYRMLTKQQLEDLIREKTGNPVTLTANGPHKYTGTRPSPDGTVRIPVVVTVQGRRIIIESSGGGMSARSVITPQGLEEGDPR
jgi:hypothetical protein